MRRGDSDWDKGGGRGKYQLNHTNRLAVKILFCIQQSLKGFTQ